MPKLMVHEVGTFDVAAGKRLVLALEDEAKLDVMHACGGRAKCTTCRVRFVSGEPGEVTRAERQILSERGLGAETGMRLSCQIKVDHDMQVIAVGRVSTTGAKDAGPRPADQIEPPAVWT